ncbi:MAG: HPr family phosphocarrier protein [Sinobacterium sp.]|nr:HPr family phosphocarrier protein [Sinobacterium sp.]
MAIINQKGLHARASVKLAELAGTFQCDITFSNQSTSADGKNVLQLMMLAASKGTVLSVEFNGDDATDAQQAIERLIANRFDEAI